jgi:hypothetical protein
MPAKTELSVGVIDELKAQGYSQSEIAEMFGVTRQAVSWHKRTYNGRRTPREEVLEDHFPWEIQGQHRNASPCRRMRDHGEYMVTGGVGMSADKLDRIRSFYRQLRDENAVLEYDPDLPSQPGFCLDGGFALRPRVASDRDLLIRVNRYTLMTDEGWDIWVFPDVDP